MSQGAIMKKVRPMTVHTLSQNTPLWAPSPERIHDLNIMAFRKYFAKRIGVHIHDTRELHALSVEHMAEFWSAIWDFCGVKGEKGHIITQAGEKPHTLRDTVFFPEATLNYAHNVLIKSDDTEAMVFNGEDQVHMRLTWRELHDMVSRFQQWLIKHDVKKGDRVAGYMPNRPETIAMMLAASGLGAVWSSCSPDFGTQGVVDRFGQIEPKVLITVDGYLYAGKRLPLMERLQEIIPRLPSLKAVMIVDYLGDAHTCAQALPHAHSMHHIVNEFEAKAVHFEPLPFNHPLYILYSSGTTGVPKCIVHGSGGVLLQHLKEHRLQCDIRAQDRFFYFTTCGWMMWNWLATGLASGATLLLYDGSPFHPTNDVLWDFTQKEKASLFGTSAKYLDHCKKVGLSPAHSHNLSHLRTITSTGSPLSAESFAYVYSDIKTDVHLASISGGTDIVSCFVGGDPALPVWSGEIQGAGLGMAVQVWNDEGQPVHEEKGELVCVKPFPCMPVMFWNDPNKTKYNAAYFERFTDVWCHGDFAEVTANGGIIIHGRSDATLNPGGVRIGTAEIYAQVEKIPQVLEAIAIGQDWDNDVRVVLFVRLKDGAVLDEALKKTIVQQIRTGASPRHVPAKIIAVADIPRTKSGKITELAVREVVHGREVKNKEALANPEALALFRGLIELAS
jgi:acetoacetyl-CoA synthetase